MTRALLFVLVLMLSAIVNLRAGEIRLAAGEYQPYTSADLPDGGMLGELTRRAFALSGYQLHIEFLPWARAVLDMQVALDADDEPGQDAAGAVLRQTDQPTQRSNGRHRAWLLLSAKHHEFRHCR